jgi:dCMP deaminase
MYLAMARAASMRATCYRLNVGCVVVHRRNVVGIGYNGAPAGRDHCTGTGCQYYTDVGCKVVHAETNALRQANSTLPGGCEVSLYVTHSPCGDCVDVILAANKSETRVRVMEVFYETAYRDPSPVKRLYVAGVDVYKLLPSGLTVEERTGDLCEQP